MTAQPDRTRSGRRTAGSVLVDIFGRRVLEVAGAVAAVVALVLVGHGLMRPASPLTGVVTAVTRRVDANVQPCVYSRCNPFYYVENVDTRLGAVKVTVPRAPRVGTHVTVYQLGNGTLVGYPPSSVEALFADLVWAAMAGALALFVGWLVRLGLSFSE